jgi:hypothetical protein
MANTGSRFSGFLDSCFKKKIKKNLCNAVQKGGGGVGGEGVHVPCCMCNALH